MKGLLITHKGMEDVAVLEVEELIDKKSQKNDTCIVFDFKNYQDLFKLCYKSQSSIGIYYLLSEFSHKNIFLDFKKNIQKIDFSEWLSKKTTFRVKCKKNYDNEISTPELEKELGALVIDNIKNKHNYKQKVNLNNPDIILFVYLTKNKCHFGIDFAGFDLSKRYYNIFMHPAAIKGTIAYFLIQLSNYKKTETLVDPFSTSGTIPIEAALLTSNFPVNFYNKEKFAFLKYNKFNNFNFEKFFKEIDREIIDNKLKIYNIDASMKHINHSKKNSKIAGIDKKINYSRIELEWLDTKFNKDQVNKIVTKMPSINTKDINKIYNEFFYHAEFILDKKGIIVLIGKKELVEKFASKHKFRISNKKSIFSGKEKYDVFVLSHYK